MSTSTAMADMTSTHPKDCTCVWCSLVRDLQTAEQNAAKPAPPPPKPPAKTAAQKADMLTTHPKDCDCVWCTLVRDLKNVDTKTGGGDATTKAAGG